MDITGERVPETNQQQDVAGGSAAGRRSAEEALRESERRLAVLNEANELLLSSEEPESVIRTIAEKAMHYLEADVFFNYVLDEGSEDLRLNAWGGVDESVAKAIERLELGQAVCGCVARDGERIISEDVQNNGDPRAELVRDMGVQCYVCHPLIVNGKPAGTLSFGTKKKSCFSPQDIDLMRSVTGQVSVALERSRRERALQESQHRVQDLIAYAPTGIYEISFSPPRFLSVNEAMSRLSGYSRDELLAMNPFDLLDEESQARFRERIAKTMAGEDVPGDVEYRVIRKDGSMIFVVLNTRLMRDAEGAVKGAFVIGHDVTERRQTEDDLAETLAEARRRAAREQVLKRVTEVASSLLPPEELAAEISRAVAALFGAKQAQLRLLSEDGKWLRSGGTYDPTGFLTSYGDMPVDAETETALAFRSGELRLAEDIAASMSEQSRVNAARSGVRSYLLLPVTAGDRKVGTFYLGWAEPRKFTEDEISFVQAVTQQFAIGLQNALLYESQRRRRHRVEALHDIVEVGLGALDVQSAAQRILDHLAAHYDFDLSSIWLAAGDTLEMIARVGYPSDWLSSITLSEPYDAAKVFNTGSRLVVRHPTNEAVIDVFKSKGIPLGSYIALPLRARGRSIGVLTLVWKTEHELNDYDVAFYDSVADEIAVVLENARLYEVEHSIAETLQETLVALPDELPEIDYARAYQSATHALGRVGGDFVDLFQVSPHVVGVVVGDVSGKGIEAAVITSLVRNTVRAHAVDGLSAARVCGKTNTVIRKFTDVEAYVTMFFGLLDTETGLLRYVSGGHPSVLCLSGGEVVAELFTGDPFLGAFEDVVFHEARTVLHPGQRLVLYTDGVTEARSPNGRDFFGPEGLKRSVRQHADKATRGLADALMSDVMEFSDGVLRDDAAILVVELTHQDG